jgi:conjugative transposon TraN protein
MKEKSKKTVQRIIVKTLLLFTVITINSNTVKSQQKEAVTRPIEVGALKTTHISFPAKIKYVDLGSNYILAGKAENAENVLRVKAAYKDFQEKTNFSVITEDGGFYLFTATYNDNPTTLYYEMQSVMALQSENRPTNAGALLSDINGESPVMLNLIMQSLYLKNRSELKHLGQRRYKIETTLKGIYVRNDMLYFHLNFKNKSNISYDINYTKFTIVDRKKLKKQAVQELPINYVRLYNGNRPEKIFVGREYHAVFAFNKFTLSSDKKLVISINERGGGRHLEFDIAPSDIIGALPIENISL